MRWPWMRAKRRSTITHAAPPGLFLGLPRVEDAQMVRDLDGGLGSSILLTTIQWLQRAALLAHPQIEQQRPEGTWRAVPASHPAQQLLLRPNDGYGWSGLIQGWIMSLLLDGNAYAVLLSGATTRRPMALWFAPSHGMTIQSRDQAFISGYERQVGGGHPAEIHPPDEILHLRMGIDPRDPRRGLSPIRSLLAELWVDWEAGRFAGDLLRNGAVPGLLIAPRGTGQITDTEARNLKDYLQEAFRGSQRGDPATFLRDFRVERPGFAPADLDLSTLRDTVEERVTAALGVPAALVGFGAGLQSTRVGATMAELRTLAWENGILPLLEIVARGITEQVLPQFGGTASLRMTWDLSAVSALQDDATIAQGRILAQVSAGVRLVSDAQAALGLPVDPSQRLYLRPFSALEVPAGVPAGARLKAQETQRRAHSPAEHQAAEQAPRRRAPRAIVAAQRQYDQILREGPTPHIPSIRAILDDLGVEVGARYEELVARKAAPDIETLLRDLLARLDLTPTRQRLATVLRAAYLTTAQAVADGLAPLGLSVGLPDPVAQAVLALGETRAGLVDLTQCTAARVRQVLSEAAAEGLGVPATARRLRAIVPGGPWSSAQTRATLIARTEIAFARNTSSLLLARQIEGTRWAQVFDARLGPTDAVCEALDGVIVSLDEAERLLLDEHPNGTRSFVPLPPAVADTMDLPT